jgi:hypothetical protein
LPERKEKIHIQRIECLNFPGLLFGCFHFGRITFHAFGAALHRTVVRHASWPFGTHSFIHAWFAVTGTHHFMVAVFHPVMLFHHSLLPAILFATEAGMSHPANATSDKTNEEEKSYYNEEPGDYGKEFARHFFFEFCKQQGACKYGKQ